MIFLVGAHTSWAAQNSIDEDQLLVRGCDGNILNRLQSQNVKPQHLEFGHWPSLKYETEEVVVIAPLKRAPKQSLFKVFSTIIKKPSNDDITKEFASLSLDALQKRFLAETKYKSVSISGTKLHLDAESAGIEFQFEHDQLKQVSFECGDSE